MSTTLSAHLIAPIAQLARNRAMELFPGCSVSVGKVGQPLTLRSLNSYVEISAEYGNAPVKIFITEEILRLFAAKRVADLHRKMIRGSRLVEGTAVLVLAQLFDRHPGLAAQLRVRQIAYTPAHYRITCDSPESETQHKMPSVQVDLSVDGIPGAIGCLAPIDIWDYAGLRSDNALAWRRSAASKIIECELFFALLPHSNHEPEYGVVLRAAVLAAQCRSQEIGMDKLNAVALALKLGEEDGSDGTVVCTVAQIDPGTVRARADLYLGSVELSLLELIELTPGSTIKLSGLNLQELELRCGKSTIARAAVFESDGEPCLRIESLDGESEKPL